MKEIKDLSKLKKGKKYRVSFELEYHQKINNFEWFYSSDRSDIILTKQELEKCEIQEIQDTPQESAGIFAAAMGREFRDAVSAASKLEKEICTYCKKEYDPKIQETLLGEE